MKGFGDVIKLVIISLVAGLCLSLVFATTKDKIEISKKAGLEKSLKEIHKLCLSESKKKDPEYNISEIAINTLGYELIKEKKEKEALEFFKINTELYPNSSNVFDSYGECLLLIGKEKEGLAADKRSLELDPKNMNADKILKKYNYN